MYENFYSKTIFYKLNHVDIQYILERTPHSFTVSED